CILQIASVEICPRMSDLNHVSRRHPPASTTRCGAPAAR
ncbi:MAG: hypothetical protein AVDCRST_MAG67-2308, partial [uncultured Solirubrobacteraceae bacterium]